MSGLSAADMAELQALDVLFMDATASLVHTTGGTKNIDGSPSGTGGTTTTTTVACRFVSTVGKEVVYGARLTQEADAIAYVPIGSVVDVQDVFVFASDHYQIINTNEGQSFATSVMLTLRLLK